MFGVKETIMLCPQDPVSKMHSSLAVLTLLLYAWSASLWFWKLIVIAF
jgi:hypothetical protein